MNDRPARIPSRGELLSLVRETLHPGSVSKPAVLVVEIEGHRGVVKDAHPLHPWLRALYGRRLLRREERALRHLDGAAGAPRVAGWVDRDALLMEFVDGLPMRGSLEGPDKSRYRRACVDLERKVRQLHERGVVHLDLRQRRNILVDEAGAVSLLDFESSLLLSHRGLGGLLLRRLAPLDLAACLKFKARYAADLLDEGERVRLRRMERLRSVWVFHHVGALLRRLFGRRESPRDEVSDS